MDGMDKVILGIILIGAAIMVIYFIGWTEINKQVDGARNIQELRVACSGMRMENAPVRCLELAK